MSTFSWLLPIVFLSIIANKTTHTKSNLQLLHPNQAENETENLFLQNCLNHVVNRNYTATGLIVVLNFSLPLNYPVVHLNGRKVRFFNYMKVEFYIINATIDNFDSIMNYTKSFTNFNPRAKFVIVSHQIDKSFFDVLNKCYTINVIFVDLLRNELFTYSPYNSQDIHQPNSAYFSIGKCESFRGFPGKNRFQNWRNSTVRVAYKERLPYVTNPMSARLKGIEIFVLETIKKRLGFNTEYFQYNATYYNVQKPETFYKAFGHLIDHEYDIGLAMFYIKFQEHLELDVSFAYLQDGVYWVVPKAQILKQWKRILLAFGFRTWISFGLTFLVVTGLYSAYFYSVQFRHHFRILMYFYGVMVEHSMTISKKYTKRIFLYGWILYSLIISTAFKSQLMNMLSGAVFEKQMDSLKDIVDSGLLISMHQDYADLYDDSEGFPLEQYVYDHNIHCPDFIKCVKRTGLQRDTASTATGRYIEQIMPEFINKKGEKMVHVLKQKVYPISVHMIFSKGFPLYKQINDQILLMEANGIVQRSYNYVSFIAKLKYRQILSVYKSKAKDLNDIQLPFLLLTFGLSLSVVLFILENLVFRFNKVKFRAKTQNKTVLENK